MIEEKPLNFKLKIIVYGREFNPNVSHSFVIDDSNSGPSSPIGELNINIRDTTLQHVRSTIEYNRTGNMMKRSLLFQEAIFIMQRLPNHFQKPKELTLKYIFGFYCKSSNDLQLIEPENEGKYIYELIHSYVDFFKYDLALVPLTQIP